MSFLDNSFTSSSIDDNSQLTLTIGYPTHSTADYITIICYRYKNVYNTENTSVNSILQGDSISDTESCDISRDRLVLKYRIKNQANHIEIDISHTPSFIEEIFKGRDISPVPFQWYKSIESWFDHSLLTPLYSQRAMDMGISITLLLYIWIAQHSEVFDPIIKQSLVPLWKHPSEFNMNLIHSQYYYKFITTLSTIQGFLTSSVVQSVIQIWINFWQHYLIPFSGGDVVPDIDPYPSLFGLKYFMEWSVRSHIISQHHKPIYIDNTRDKTQSFIDERTRDRTHDRDESMRDRTGDFRDESIRDRTHNRDESMRDRTEDFRDESMRDRTDERVESFTRDRTHDRDESIRDRTDERVESFTRDRTESFRDRTDDRNESMRDRTESMRDRTDDRHESMRDRTESMRDRTNDRGKKMKDGTDSFRDERITTKERDKERYKERDERTEKRHNNNKHRIMNEKKCIEGEKEEKEEKEERSLFNENMYKTGSTYQSKTPSDTSEYSRDECNDTCQRTCQRTCEDTDTYQEKDKYTLITDKENIVNSRIKKWCHHFIESRESKIIEIIEKGLSDLDKSRIMGLQELEKSRISIINRIDSRVDKINEIMFKFKENVNNWINIQVRHYTKESMDRFREYVCKIKSDMQKWWDNHLKSMGKEELEKIYRVLSADLRSRVKKYIHGELSK